MRSVAVEVAVLHGAGYVGIAPRPCIGQLAAGACPAAENIGERRAALHPLLAEPDDGGDGFVQRPDVHIRAGIDDQHGIFIARGHPADALRLGGAEVEFAFFQLLVRALARLTGDDVYRRVAVRGGDVRVRYHAPSWRREGLNHAVHQPRTLCAALLPPAFLRLAALGLKIAYPAVARYLIARKLQSLKDRNGVALIDLAGAGSALDGARCSRAVERYSARLHRQRAVVFEQDYPLPRGGAGKLAVFALARRDAVVRGGSDDTLFHGSPPYQVRCTTIL